MLHVFKGEILANMTQVSDVAPGPLVLLMLCQDISPQVCILIATPSMCTISKHSENCHERWVIETRLFW
jgi:hypothetical protein